MEALMAIPAMPRMVPATAPLSRSDPVLRFVRSRQGLFIAAIDGKRVQPLMAGASWQSGEFGPAHSASP